MFPFWFPNLYVCPPCLVTRAGTISRCKIYRVRFQDNNAFWWIILFILSGKIGLPSRDLTLLYHTIFYWRIKSTSQYLLHRNILSFVQTTDKLRNEKKKIISNTENGCSKKQSNVSSKICHKIYEIVEEKLLINLKSSFHKLLWGQERTYFISCDQQK